MPLVQVKDVGLADSRLNRTHDIELSDEGEQCVTCVNEMHCRLQALTTLVSQRKRRHEHDNVVDDTVEVENVGNTRRDFGLNLVEGLGIVLEAECLMLVMDERLPAPNAAEDLLPQGQVFITVVSLKPVLDLLNGLVPEGIEGLQSLNILFISHAVLDVDDGPVLEQHGEKHLERLILNRVIAHIQMLHCVAASERGANVLKAGGSDTVVL